MEVWTMSVIGAWVRGAALAAAVLAAACSAEGGAEDGAGSGPAVDVPAPAATPMTAAPQSDGGSQSQTPAGDGATPNTGADAMPPPAQGAAGTASMEPMMPETDGGAGQMAVDMAPPAGSSGCGAADWPADGDQSIDVEGTPREYIVSIPADYDPNTPYKLVFAWHGLGGTAAQIAGGFRGGYYGLEPMAGGTTIFVAGQGLETSNSVGSGPGWDNTNGRDVAFTSAMLQWLRASYCIDDERIFSVGMSYGGIMSNRVGCSLGEDFRAIAPMAGSGPGFGSFGANCVGQVAAWITHGNTDNIVSFSSGQASRDHWAMANGCDDSTTPVGPEACVAYDGCDPGYPVHWCEFDGGHTVPGFAAAAVWAFFSQF
jgi:poly(3-hydroxybutyrate) depolymerase